MRRGAPFCGFLLCLALTWTGHPPGPVVGPAGPTSSEYPPELQRILHQLAERAALHRSMLYEFNCIEELTRLVYEAYPFGGSGILPKRTIRDRYSLVVAHGERGAPAELRFKLDEQGQVQTNRKGVPVQARLDRFFRPIAKAVPHAQVSWFTADYQSQLRFAVADEEYEAVLGYRLRCSEESHVVVEFMDRDPPARRGSGKSAQCSGRPSGRMCIDPETGEITGVEFYRLYLEGDQCRWDRRAPFAKVEQELVERESGLRFPSHVETYYPLRRQGETAIIVQEFRDCVFTKVRVHEDFKAFPEEP